jgi:hypothetical protein
MATNKSNLWDNQACVKDLLETQAHTAVISAHDADVVLEKVHNFSLAMEMIRANAKTLEIKDLSLLPDEREDVYHLVDARIVSVCLDTYNEQSGDSYQWDRRSFCIAQRANLANWDLPSSSANK